MKEERQDHVAYASPEADGSVYVGETLVSDEGVVEKHESPFDFDIVYESHPEEGRVEEDAKALGQAFSKQFDEAANEVFEQLEDSDDPLDALMNMKPE